MKLSKLLLIAALALIVGCVKPFDTPRITADNTLLVVDGILNGDSTTTITLTRTRSLSDTTAPAAEKDAQLSLLPESGGEYVFLNAGDGSFRLENTPLQTGSKYKLHIKTSNGKEYFSDAVQMQRTPPIDSLQWDQHDDIFIYVNTHDPQNSTRYYRWDFTETSEYHTAYDSHLDFQNGQVVFIQPADYRYTCYKTFNSTNIEIGTSAALASDVITHQQINRIPNDNTKISVRYSILVRQNALTADAYKYWKTLKQNSEQVGGLFDPQPSQLHGNIHCVNNPNEDVLGYISGSSVSTARLFIRNNELTDRKEIQEEVECRPTVVSNPDSLAILMQQQPYLPAYFQGAGTLVIAPAYCVDCRLRGGVTTKPSFW